MQSATSIRNEQFELLNSKQFMPRVFEVNKPCQWLTHCYDGKCPALIRKNGNLYCARKEIH